MTEFRRDRELPFVETGDTKAVRKMADLLEAVTGFDLPGLGIVNTDAEWRPLRTTHNLHRKLILDAFRLLRPSVLAAEEFELAKKHYPTVTPAHEDVGRHWVPDSRGRLKMGLRLHTTSQDCGAYVDLANSAPGCMARPGDRTLFYGENRAEYVRRQYDNDSKLPVQYATDLAFLMDDGTYDPIVSEPDVFHFEQTPLSSVLFRSASSIGPVAIHSFRSVNPGQRRDVTLSDVPVYSQTL